MANSIGLGVSFAVGAVLAPSVATTFGTVDTKIKALRGQVNAASKESKALQTAIDLRGQRDKLISQFRAAGGDSAIRKELERVVAEYRKAKKAALDYGASVADWTKKQEAANRSIELANEKLRIYQKIKDEGKKRAELRGRIVDTLTVAAPLIGAVKTAGQFESVMTDIAVTAQMTKEETGNLASAIQENSLKYGQTIDEMTAGMSGLAKAGITSKAELDSYGQTLGVIAAATNASTTDVSASFQAMRSKLGITAEETKANAEILYAASKRGKMEAPAVFQALPSLARTMADSFGQTGKKAIADIGANLEIARKGTGTDEEATANVQSFLAQLSNPKFVTNLQKGGINVPASLAKLIASKKASPTEAALAIARVEMNKIGGPGAFQQYQAALRGDIKGPQAARAKILGKSVLNKMFKDQGSLNFMQQAIKHEDELKDIKQQALASAGGGLLDKDAETRMDTWAGEVKQFRTALSDLGITIGSAVLPPAKLLLQGVTWITSKVAAFAAQHKVLTGVIFAPLAGFTATALALFGIGYAVSLVKTGLDGLKLLIGVSRVLWIKKTAAMLWNYTVTKTVAAAHRIAAATTRAWNTALAVGRGISVRATMAMVAHKTVAIGSAVATKTWAAAQWLLNAAMTANPIGLVVVAVGALAAGFVWLYRNCEPVRAVLGKIWSVVKVVGKAFIDALWIPVVFTWKAISAIWSGAGSFFSAIWRGISGFASAAWDVITTGAGWVVDGIYAVFGPVIGFFSAIWDAVKAPAVAVFEWIGAKFEWVTSKLGWVVEGWQKIKAAFSFGDEKASPQAVTQKTTASPPPKTVMPAVGATVPGRPSSVPGCPSPAPGRPYETGYRKQGTGDREQETGGRNLSPDTRRLKPDRLAPGSAPAVSTTFSFNINAAPDAEFSKGVIEALRRRKSDLEDLISTIVHDQMRLSYGG